MVIGLSTDLACFLRGSDAFQFRGREFAPAGDLLSFVLPNARRQTKGDSAERLAVELAARRRRCAQTTTASQVADGRPVSQQSCGRSAESISAVTKHAKVKTHSAPRARASVAHCEEVLLISGGCVSVAPQARSEFRRTAVGRRASLVTFLSRTRKSLGRRDEIPASVDKTSSAFKKAQRF